MFDTNRRSGISTSELGLYSDRNDRRCHKSGHGTVVIKQFVVVVMIIITIILIALYVYDVTSSTSILHRPGFETKHLHVYRNTFKTPNTNLKNSSLIPLSSISQKHEDHSLTNLAMQDRSDTVDPDDILEEDSSWSKEDANTNVKPESRTQTLQNFKLKNQIIRQFERDRNEESDERRFFDNHSMVYRIKPSPKKMFVDNDDDEMVGEESDPEPSPFHFQFKTPYPSSFKRLKYPQLTQYRYPHTSRSIQDIIKYMINNPANPQKAIKFTGVYLNPKKFDADEAETEDFEETLQKEESSTPISVAYGDPLFRYKPKHPADVNLLASSNLRFSPFGIQRFSPYNTEPYYYRPGVQYFKPTELDTTGVYSASNNVNNIETINSNNKKRKAKPFSVMLDIYPITDINEYQSKKTAPVKSKPHIEYEDFESRRPMHYVSRFPRTHQIPLNHPNKPNFPIEDEKQQMILHLNLYPRKKGRINRNEILRHAENELSDEKQNGSKQTVSPFQMIANQLSDHFAIEKEKFDEHVSPENMSESRNNDIRKMRLHQKALNYASVTQKYIGTTMATVCEHCLDSTTQDIGYSMTKKDFQGKKDNSLTTE